MPGKYKTLYKVSFRVETVKKESIFFGSFKK